MAQADGRLKPVNVREVWDEAQPLIEAALSGSDDEPEQLRLMCERGEAFILASESAFVVVQKVPAPGAQFDAVIWAAVARGPVVELKQHLQCVESAPIVRQARYVVFYTPRTGYGRLMPHDWKIHQLMWAKRLNG